MVVGKMFQKLLLVSAAVIVLSACQPGGAPKNTVEKEVWRRCGTDESGYR
jgi:hypothetical protein